MQMLTPKLKMLLPYLDPLVRMSLRKRYNNDDDFSYAANRNITLQFFAAIRKKRQDRKNTILALYGEGGV